MAQFGAPATVGFRPLLLLLLLLSTTPCTAGLDVLVSPSLGSPAFNTLRVARALHDAGHNVTVLADRYIERLTQAGEPEAALYAVLADPPFKVAWYDSGLGVEAPKQVAAFQALPPLEGMRPLLEFIYGQCPALLSQPDIQGGTWDVLVYAYNFPCNGWLPDVINLRGGAVGLLTAGFILLPENFQVVDFNPAYVPVMSSGLVPEMNFWQRLRNLGQSIAAHILFSRTRKEVVGKALAQLGIPLSDPPPIHASRSGSLFLVTNHWGYEYPAYHSPATQLIGSLTATEGQAVPGDLGAWLAAGSGPLIVLSFGSASYLSTATIGAFSRAFATLPAEYRMVWKLKTREELAAAQTALTTLGVEQHRVWLALWIPYNDLLADPATALALVHCGNNGMSEVMFHGVPIVGVPQFGDQFDNCNKAARAGFGLFVPRDELSAERLEGAMHRVLHEPSFAASAARMRRISRGAPRMEGALRWVEYVGENGVGHLTMRPAAKLTMLQYFSVDTVAFALAVGGLVACACFALSRCLLRAAWRCCCRLPASKTANAGPKQD